MATHYSVYDLEHLAPEALRARVHRTLAGRPRLQQIFTEESIDLHIGRRRHGETLLLRLVSYEDAGTQLYWDEIEAHLTMLGTEAYKFAEPIRNSDPVRHEGWRTELFFAAWIHEVTGATIDVEPAHGAARAEFRALLAPELWFEVKSPKNAGDALAFEPIDDLFHRLLNKLPERFTVHMTYASTYEPLHVNDVPAIVRELRRTLAAAPLHDRAPILFASHGILFEAEPCDAQSGGLGIVEGPQMAPGNDTNVAYDHIRTAAKKCRPIRPASSLSTVQRRNGCGTAMCSRRVLGGPMRMTPLRSRTVVPFFRGLTPAFPR